MFITVVHNSTDYNFLLNRNKQSASSLKKNLEKISSGYQVNRAADDAAGLAVSEKMRGIIAGLNQGIDNINDGISYIHSVDGASQEIQDVLHRLYVLADQAANGTYDDEVDRRAIDREYQQLIDEIDQMTDTANFNDLPLFEKHMSEYGLYEGNIVHEEPIVIDETNDCLVFGYNQNDTHKEITLNLEHGRYLTPEELADEIDSVLYNDAHDLIIGVDDKGQFTIQCENGDMEYICGTGASLFYDRTQGVSGGCLLGVTDFLTDKSELKINSGKNDVIQFRFANEDVLHSITIEEGFYTRSQLIDKLNEKFKEAGISDIVKAEAVTSDDGRHVIALNSKDAVTGLAGNFIRMDTKSGSVIENQSPICDISYYADEKNTQAVVDGKKVISETNGVEIVRGRNDYFYVNYADYDSPTAAEYKISLLDDGENVKTYTREELAERINAEFEKNNIRATAFCDDETGGTIDLKSDQYGEKCLLDLVENKVPSDYALHDLFDAGALKEVSTTRSKSTYSPFYFNAYKSLSSGVTVTQNTDELTFRVTYRNNQTASSTTTAEIKFDLGVTSSKTMTKDQILSALNSQLGNYTDPNGVKLSDIMEFSLNSYGGLKLEGKSGIVSDSVMYATALQSSSGYRTFIRDVTYSQYTRTVNGTSTDVYTDTDDSKNYPYYMVAGTTSEANSYVNSQVFSAGATADYLKYQTVTVSPIAGTSTNTASGESQVGNYVHTQGSTTFNSIGTLFTASNGHGCLKDFSLTLDFYGKNGASLGKKTISVSEGDTYDTFKSKLQSVLNNNGDTLGTVEYNGDSFTITTFAAGEGARIEASGTMLQSASVNPIASRDGAVVDWDTGKVSVPSTLTVSNVYSHFTNGSLTLYSSDQKDADGNVTQKQNNILRITVGSKSYNLDLTGTYRSVSELCSAINTELTNNNTGVTAKLSSDGKGIVYYGPAGSTNSISISAADFTGQSHLGETKMTASAEGAVVENGKILTPAKLVFTQISNHFPFTPTSSNNTLEFKYMTAANVEKTLTVTLNAGQTYDGSSIASAISNADTSTDGLSAVYKDGQLIVTTNSKGDGAKFISVGGTSNLQKIKNSSETITGGVVVGNKVETKGYLYNDYFYTLDDYPMIIDSTNKTIALNVNGKAITTTLAEGTYSSLSALYSECKKKIEAACTGNNAVTVSYTGSYSKLVLSTNATGTDAKISVASNNTAPIFSYASVDSSPSIRYCTDNRCSITGTRDISEGVTLHYWDNSFTFSLTPEGETTAQSYTITLGDDLAQGGTEERTYTAEEIKKELQEKLNAVAGFKDDAQTIPILTVTLNGGKLGIKGTVSSNTLGINDFEGKLFDKIFQGAVYGTGEEHTDTEGTTVGETLSYLIGRNDMEPETEDEIESGKNVIICKGINDEIKFDFTYNGRTQTISFTIAGGAYTREELAEAIQTNGRNVFSSLTDENGKAFASDFFNVSIGLEDLEQYGVKENNTGISSENKLVYWCKLPDDGTHEDVSIVLDGMRGNSAYKIFYDSANSPSPTTILGIANLENGLTVDSSNDSMSFFVDGESVSIRIRHGDYETCGDLCDALNSALEEAGGKVGAMVKDNHIQFYTTKNGDFVFDKFSGGGADAIFYGKDSRDEDTEIGIMVGRRTNDYIWIQKTRVDDHLMHINTTGITTVERALKAMDRLTDANNYLSRWRALSGANENRSEHTLSRTNVYIENLTAAESRIRDTDVAEQFASLIRNQILMQAQQSMFSAAQEHMSSALDILA